MYFFSLVSDIYNKVSSKSPYFENVINNSLSYMYVNFYFNDVKFVSNSKNLTVLPYFALYFGSRTSKHDLL